MAVKYVSSTLNLLPFKHKHHTIFAAMTWLKLIFPFYILLLACLPCADYCSNNESQSHTTTINKQTHEHNDTEKESCSPFCFCACCGTQIHFPQLPQISFQKQSFSTSPKHSIYKFSFQTVFYNIWQPPQLC